MCQILKKLNYFCNSRSFYIYAYILILFNINTLSTAANIRCIYRSYQYHISKSTKGEFYSCDVFNEIYLNIRTRGEEITNVLDTHFSLRPVPIKNISRVAINSETIWYLPKGFNKFFPKLNNLAIEHCDLKEITQNDLKVFPELLYLNFGHNDIQFLEKDLFKFNPNLFHIIFKKNDIDFINPNILDDLNNLNIFDVTINRCISGIYTFKQLKKLKQAIKDHCQKSELAVKKVEISQTEKKRGKYFWILAVCGVIAAVFFIFAGIIFVHGAVNVYKSENQ